MAQQVRRRSPWLGLAALAVVLAAGPVRAQVVDQDGDGVSDDVDQCPDTPAGDVVGDDGCSLCPCDQTADGSDWDSRRAYLTCVNAAVKERVAAGRLDREGRRLALRSARASSCGKPDMVRCCVYPHFDPLADVNVGHCRIVAENLCDDLSDRLDNVESLDSGSCYPNPCTM